jgi:hypothetical protein
MGKPTEEGDEFRIGLFILDVLEENNIPMSLALSAFTEIVAAAMSHHPVEDIKKFCASIEESAIRRKNTRDSQTLAEYLHETKRDETQKET